MGYKVERFDVDGLGSEFLILPYVDVNGGTSRNLENFSRVVFDSMASEYRSLLKDRVKLIALNAIAVRFYTEDLYVQVPYFSSIANVAEFGNSEHELIAYSEIEVLYDKGVSTELLKYTEEDIWYGVEVKFMGDTVGDADVIADVQRWSGELFDMLLSHVYYENHIKDVAYIGFDMDDEINRYTMKCRIYDSFGNYVELTLGYYEDYSGGGTFLSDVTYG